MISYELAKQLKDAGFPQHGRGIFIGKQGTNIGDNVDIPWACYVPTLSELIEACLRMGDQKNKPFFVKLVCSNPDPNSSIYSYGVQSEAQNIRDITYFLSPEEAVAHLWLELFAQSKV